MRREGYIGALAATVALTLSGAGPAAAQERPSIRLEVGGYAQFQFHTTSVDLGDEEAGSTWEMRRLRPTFEVSIDDWITAEIVPDLAMGRLRIADAWIDFALAEPLEVQIGQFKKPFGLVELSSSSQLIVIERGLRIRGLANLLSGSGLFAELHGGTVAGGAYEILDELGYSGRDLGLQIHGETGRLAYRLGFFNGEGSDALDDHEGKSFAGRLVVQPAERWPLRLGAAASYRETADAEADFGTGDGLVVPRDAAGAAFEVDAEWGAFRRPGARVQLELSTGENIAAVEDASFFGAHALAGWFWPLDGERVEGFELDGRASYGDPRTDFANDEAWLFTPGAVLYFTGRNRILVNWDYFAPAADALDAQHAFRTQFQVYF